MTETSIHPALTGKYTLDPAHSRVGFVARHAMVTKVRGAFNEVEGAGFFDAGDLTIKGITKPVGVDLEFTGAATDPFGNQRIGLEGQTTVNRKDWGVTWNAALETGGVLVSEKVTLELEISAIKSADS